MTSRHVWRGAAVLFVLLLAYMLIWWNRGIALNSNGLMTLAGQAVLDGKLPYRDFHYWCPPVHILTYTALIALVGDGLIYVRAYAVAEHLAIFLLSYFWLARFFRPWAAFYGVMVAAVACCSDTGDVIAHYNFDALLGLAFAGYVASIAMSSKRVSHWHYVLTGVGAGICLMSKQTTGVGVFLIFPVVFFFGDPARRLSVRLRTIAEYFAGWLVPVAAVYAWLAPGEAWSSFVNQTLLQGTSSKGSMGSILFRPLLTLGYDRGLRNSFIAAVVLLCTFGWWLYRQSGKTDGERHAWIVWLAAPVALAAGVLLGLLPLIPPESWPVRHLLTMISAMFIFLTLMGSGILAFRYTAEAVGGRLDAVGVQKWIYTSLSFVAAYMFSLSFAAFEPMLIPGLAFLIAMTLDRQPAFTRWRNPAVAAVLLGMLLISTAAIRKLTWPYLWENWSDQPIRTQNAASEFPEMRGLRIAPESAAFLSRVTATIDAHSRPDETILCYPNYALFYVLAHRAPATFAYMHWFDIVSDKLAREEAVRVRERRPAVILMADMPEHEIRRLEVAYRGGKPSGQREMASTIEGLAGYRLIDTVPIPHVDYPLKIYARE
jgi:hypothetical protein